MRVEVRLFATLRKYLPAGGEWGKAVLELPQGARLAEVVERLGIPRELAQLAMVDGEHEPDLQRRLERDCTVSIFPPVAGGE